MSDSSLNIPGVLSSLLRNSKVSEAELSRLIGIPRATINRITSGRTPDPRASTLQAIAEYFNVSVDQLMGKQPIKPGEDQTQYTNIPIIQWEKCKQWEIEVKNFKKNAEKTILVEAEACNGKFALNVHGEAMWPQFQENDLLIIDPERKAKNRDFVLANMTSSGEIVFRQLISDGKHRLLKPINTIFPTIKLNDDDKILGVIIQSRSNLG